MIADAFFSASALPVTLVFPYWGTTLVIDFFSFVLGMLDLAWVSVRGNQLDIVFVFPVSLEAFEKDGC